MPYTMEDALRALDRKQGLDQQAAAGPKQLARMALLRGRHIVHLPYSEHPGSPFFYHGRIVHPDTIVSDKNMEHSGANSPYLGKESPRGFEFMPAYPDPGFERRALSYG